MNKTDMQYSLGIFPNKFKFLYSSYKEKKVKILDIGCGNNSARITKNYFPLAEYSWVDHTTNYKNETSEGYMDHFYLIDLQTSNLSTIPDNTFDVVILSHVIEHLFFGDQIIKEAISKLKTGGYIYIEYPSVKSLSLPRHEGTLHFSDDATHIRLYDLKEIGNILLSENCTIIFGWPVRNRIKVFLFPFFWMLSKITPISANYLWDYYGFAEYMLWQKKE